jgi:predicted ATPase
LLYEAARDDDRAAQHFLLAAENAVRVSAHRDAVALADRGLSVLGRLPESLERARRQVAFLIARGVAQVATQGFASPLVEETYAAAQAVCERFDDAPSLFPVLYGLWNVSLLRCDIYRCKELAEQMFEIARGRNDPVHSLEAHNVLQQPLFHLGEFAAARQHQERAQSLYDSHVHRTLTAVYGEDPGVGCLAYGAVTLWHLGYPDQAIQAVEEARQTARILSYPFNVARALYFGAFTHLCRREAERAEDLAKALLHLSTDQGFAMHVHGAEILIGWSMTQRGDWDDGIRQMQQGLQGWKSTQAMSHYAFHLAHLAEAFSRTGRVHEGLAAIDEALSISSATGERFCEAELHRIRGELLLLARPPELRNALAEAEFRRALAIAGNQSAKSMELRAAVSLARQTLRTRRPLDAPAILNRVYESFTEGWDTPDLLDARQLIEQLQQTYLDPDTNPRATVSPEPPT